MTVERPPSQAGHADSIIEVEGAGKSFDQQGTQAFHQVFLHVQPGEFVSLVGPSGCGKTTLLRCIAGLESLTTGAIRVRGQQVRGIPRACTYVFQDYTRSLFPWRTLLDNVAFAIEGKVGRRRARVAAQEYVELVRLDGYERHYPWQLSGGMQQRGAIARALAAEPDILLMDEPFGAVDAQTRMGLQDIVQRIWKELRKTILFVTHDIDEAVYLSNRVYVMSAAPGTIEAAYDVPLDHPRDQIVTRADATFQALRADIFGVLKPSE